MVDTNNNELLNKNQSELAIAISACLVYQATLFYPGRVATEIDLLSPSYEARQLLYQRTVHQVWRCAPCNHSHRGRPSLSLFTQALGLGQETCLCWATMSPWPCHHMAMAMITATAMNYQ